MASDSEDELEYNERFCCLKRCPGVCSEPVAKRTRSSHQQLKEIVDKENSSDEPTILDMLNEDCWRVLFGYVDVEQLILSERVSQRWRVLVQRYLQGIPICLRSSRYNRDDPGSRPARCRVLSVPPRDFTGVVGKLGRAIVAADCFDAPGLRALGAHCPDIEDLTIHEPRFHQVKNLVVHFSKLKSVSFRDVIHLRDDYVSKFLQVNTPENLVIANNVRISGLCLTSLSTNLRSLGLHACGFLDVICVLLAADRLAELKELRMNGNSALVLEDVFILIEQTPKLEYLCLEWYTIWEDVDVGGLVDAICRLKNLRHLSFHNNDIVRDDWLEQIGRCCKELRIVDIGGCYDVTAAGIDALCRGVAETLTVLDVSGNKTVTNDHVVRWIYQCPKLEILDVHFCSPLTRELVTRCRQAVILRPRALRLRVMNTKVQLKEDNPVNYLHPHDRGEILEKYPNLILEYSYGKINYRDFVKLA